MSDFRADHLTAGNSRQPTVPAPSAVAICLIAMVLLLPLMLGDRTPEAMTNSGLMLLLLAFLATLLAWRAAGREFLSRQPLLPTRGWWLVFALMSLTVLMQVLPLGFLARWFGPYPDAFWSNALFEPRFWSPNPAASLRGWAVFVGLFTVAWLAGSLDRRQRNWVWLALALSALFQASYGMLSHFLQAETIFGIWERRSLSSPQGSFSNRNLFAAYLALTWPLAVAVWWRREMPLLARLPKELRVTGSMVSAALIGTAIFASASRLSSMAALVGAIAALLLLTRYRGRMPNIVAWPAWTALAATFLLAVWVGLEPLTERLAISEADGYRRIAFELMLRDLPLAWWLHGVGLGGFEAVFRLVQPDQIGGWWDYAHSDVLQWLLEMGLVGALLAGLVAAALIKNARLSLERIPLYGGLFAMLTVATADFSWHMPATQVVLAIYIGVLLQPARNGHRKGARGRHEKVDEGRPVRRRRRRRSGGLRQDLLN